MNNKLIKNNSFEYHILIEEKKLEFSSRVGSGLVKIEVLGPLHFSDFIKIGTVT